MKMFMLWKWDVTQRTNNVWEFENVAWVTLFNKGHVQEQSAYQT